MYIPQNMQQATTYLLSELICTATATVKPEHTELRAICSSDTMNKLKSSITGVQTQFNSKPPESKHWKRECGHLHQRDGQHISL